MNSHAVRKRKKGKEEKHSSSTSMTPRKEGRSLGVRVQSVKKKKKGEATGSRVFTSYETDLEQEGEGRKGKEKEYLVLTA